MASDSGPTQHVLPTLVPCDIAPCQTTVTKQLWDPKVSDEVEPDGSKKVTAYFRGRRLVGKEFELPATCTGFIPDQQVLEQTKQASKKRSSSAGGFDEDETEGVGAESGALPRVQTKYRFSKLRVLGHEDVPADDSPHLKAVQEWIKMAGVIHKN